MWIFGYGSLVWRPSYPYRQAMDAWIEGWERRFWQGSPDHRGLPGAPGRVVTLVESPGVTCWGRAYEIADDEVAETLAHLDHREKGGYLRLEVEIFFAGDGLPVSSRPEVQRRAGSSKPRMVKGLCYFADDKNEEYLGEAPLEVIADQVLRSRGPSGSNVEYVLKLAEALRSMGAEDLHLDSIEALVRAGIARGEGGDPSG